MKIVIVLTSILFTIICVPLSATIVYIPGDFLTIQQGIDSSLTGDTVLVFPGTYAGANFNGKEVTLCSQYLTTSDTSYISTTVVGNLTLVNSEDEVPIIGLTVNGEINSWSGASVILQYCTVRDANYGVVLGIGSYGNVIDHCQFINISNIAVVLGEDSPCGATITNSYFEGNGIGVSSFPEIGSCPIDSCEFANNNLALYGELSVTNSTIRDGGKGTDGTTGPIGDNNSFTNCLFKNLSDVAVTSAWVSTFKNCIFENNTGTIAYANGERHLTFKNCEFKNNPGIGIRAFLDFTGSLGMDSCLYAFNAEPVVYSSNGSSAFNITNCTFVDNDSSAILAGTETADINITNTIIANNGFEGANCTSTSGTITVSCCNAYNNAGGDYAGFPDPSGSNGNISEDARFCHSDTGNYYIYDISTCAPENNSCESLIGCYPVDCYYTNRAWYVDDDGSDLTGDGSELLPFGTIQHAIDTSYHGDTVLVQPGTYVENINFNGRNIILGSLFLTTEDTSYISQTIIDGDSAGTVVTLENGEDSTTALTGFTIQNGYADVEGGGGGGIFIHSSNPRIKYCIIKDNISNDGGGMHIEYSDVYISDCLIMENESPPGGLPGGDNGGGIVIYENSLDLIRCTISNNFADWGGGLAILGTEVNIVDCLIEDNVANGTGGGIYFMHWASGIIDNCIIINNTANVYQAGGIASQVHCDIEVKSSLIAQNTANSGAVALLCQEDDTFLLTNCTLVDNQGGGVESANESHITLNNSILWNNNPIEIVESGGGSVDAFYSDVEGGYGVPADSNISANPLFANPNDDNYHLTRWSPCIDKGDPGSPLDPDGTRADIGAYYYNQTLPTHFWIVDISGTPGVDCDCNDIQACIDTAISGDTVLVYPGTYTVNVILTDKNIVLGSQYLMTEDTSFISNTIIDGNSSETVIDCNNIDSTSIITGFTLQNGDMSGIDLSQSSPLIISNIIKENYADSGGGIICRQSNPLIINNLIISNSAWAGNAGAILCHYYSSPLIINNTISGNIPFDGFDGAISCSENSHPIIKNTILWGDSVDNEIIHDGSSNPTIIYSNVEGGYGVPADSNINADPLFTDAEGGDFHLLPGSPCIDAGDPGSPLDPDSSRADIGAFYFHQYEFFSISGVVHDTSSTGGNYFTEPNGDWPVYLIQDGDTLDIQYTNPATFDYQFDNLLPGSYEVALMRYGMYKRDSLIVELANTDITDADFVFAGYPEVNGNNINNIGDLNFLVQYFRGYGSGPAPYRYGDYNGSFSVNGLDITYPRAKFSGDLPPNLTYNLNDSDVEANAHFLADPGSRDSIIIKPSFNPVIDEDSMFIDVYCQGSGKTGQ